MSEQPILNIGVGMPAWIYLNLFGRVIFDAFGSYPFLVGSATTTKQWRDIDVRLILDDETFERIVGKPTKPEIANRRWFAMTAAFSELGRKMTGLPIDFQIQQMTQANDEYPHQHRCALIGANLAES